MFGLFLRGFIVVLSVFGWFCDCFEWSCGGFECVWVVLWWFGLVLVMVLRSF